ncbi:hypothetical protein Ga0061079_104114 [Apibacter mensalis]|uniref:Uncharacterized protein n=1 Tax=Apibacter mensalis TaxID=1586267 RepID=A0A0X3APL6_9FLAO|nr:hypothetical protein [Apibacter mensalis]CVK15995.1 hypothetical protein Ga0061079_104114 [Apibacter mensalis]
MLRLKYRNFQQGEIFFTDKKHSESPNRKREISAILTPKINKIIQQWGNAAHHSDNYLFPYLKDDETAEQEKTL